MEKVYDLNHKNEYIGTKNEIDSVLSLFPKVPIDSLPKDYLKSSQINDPKFIKMVKGKLFYVLTKKDCYRKILGNHRIKDIISKDSRYHAATYYSDKKLYLCIDKRVLYKALKLQDKLTSLGHDRNAFYIKSGYRTPAYNKRIGGASRSRHIAGEALDLKIKDINGDGKFTQEDKQIVLGLCENFIIRNMGGIGLYPGTNTVHIDVRGHRARWNSY